MPSRARTRSTTSWEVGPAALSTTRTPSSPSLTSAPRSRRRLLRAAVVGAVVRSFVRVLARGVVLGLRSRVLQELGHAIGGVEPLVVAEEDLRGVADPDPAPSSRRTNPDACWRPARVF